MSSPRRPCSWCGKQTRRETICATCDNQTGDLELTDGHWWNDRGIMRWAATTQPEPTITKVFTPTEEPLTVEEMTAVVLATTAKLWSLTVDEVIDSQRREASSARRVAMVALRAAGLSTSKIGRIFDRDHTTVLYSTKRATDEQHHQATQIAALLTSEVHAA